jgi:hypothetical protein
MDFVAGGLRLHWDPEQRLVISQRNLARHNTPEENERCARFIQEAVGAAKAYAVVIAWYGEGDTSLEDKAFWAEFFKTWPPRRLALIQPGDQAKQGAETLGLLRGFEVRVFPQEDAASLWAVG